MSTKAVHDAMTAHAIKFGKWLQGCGHYPHETYEDKWINKKYREIKTTEQLYQLFIKQYNNH